MNRKTIWVAIDRQGEKFFSERPSFIWGRDIFSGKRFAGPIDRRKVRIIRKFKPWP